MLLGSGPDVDRRTVLAGLAGVSLGTTLPTGSAGADATDPAETALPSAYALTARPDEAGAGATRSLAGTWDFALSGSETPPTDATRRITPDRSGSGNDATLRNGPTVVTDESERALDLSGNQYVAVGDADSLDFTAPGFTVELTFRYDGDGPLFSKGGNQYSLGIWGGQLSFWTEGGGSWPGVDASDLTRGRWYTVAVVVDDSEIRVYVDGDEVGSTAHEMASLPSADSPLHVGYDAGNDDYGAPVADSLRAFDAALTADQVAGGFDGIPDSAVAWLPIDTASNGVTPDESGVGNDGTLSGDPSWAPGRGGQGLSLAGDGHVSVGSSESLAFGEPGFALHAVVRYDGGGGLVLDRGSSAVSGGTEQFGLGVYDGTPSFWFQTANGDWPTVSGGSLTAGEWHALTVVVAGDEVRLSVDGEEVAATAHDANGLASSDADLVVGGNDLDVDVKTTGALDAAPSADAVADGFRWAPSSAVLWLTYSSIEDLGVEWRDESVPGQWAHDGYVVPDEASEWYPPEGTLGWYRREFAVPDGWDGGRLKLRFDAVYSEATVFVNGTEVGSHVGGHTPFEVDVTDVVDPDGTNALAVGVSQQSKADEMGWQNVTGGIPRDVTLLSVPETHLADVFVRSDLADDGASATVRADVTVRNAGESAVGDATVTATLTDPDGDRVGAAERALSSLESGGKRTVTVEFDVEDPRTWNPEQPRLYDVAVELTADGTTERATERVGIRTVEVDGTDLLINGESVTLRGVNWEEIHLAEHGHAVPPAVTRADARRLKEANVNYVRTAHHPTSEAFLDACDELGIVVEVEAPLTFLGGHRTDPYPDLVVQQVLEMVERDKNRASVCIWSLANESSWYNVFDTAATRLKAVDPTRPIIFNGAEHWPDAPYHGTYDFYTHHYPAFRADSSVAAYGNLDTATLFDEYAHVYCYNDTELVTDPGLRDQWGRLFETVWEQCREADSVAGAALWAGGDHLEQWGEYLWGVLDRNRRERPEYWHVKTAYAPVQVTDVEWTGRGRVTVTVENRHEFVDLAERSVSVEHRGETEELSLEAAPGESAQFSVAAGGRDVRVTVDHPLGFRINEATLSPEDPPSRQPDAPRPARHPEAAETDDAVELDAGEYSLTVARDDGSVTFACPDGDALLDGTPDLVLTQTPSATGRDYASRIDHRPGGRSVSAVSLGEDESSVVIDLAYDRVSGTITLRPLDGGVEVAYDFALDESVSAREVGVVLPASPSFERLRWDRDGRLRAYPEDHVGRERGTAAAFPGGSRPDREGIAIQSGQPWKDDATSHGSNDFRSTKRDVAAATLGDGDERGVHVLGDGEQHVRASVEDGRVDLLVLDRSISGTNADGWLNRHAVAGDDPALADGERLRGTATLAAVGAIPSPYGDDRGERGGKRRGGGGRGDGRDDENRSDGRHGDGRGDGDRDEDGHGNAEPGSGSSARVGPPAVGRNGQ
ncbi:LamG-like jellyroll fold domain-containing protein [Halosimplex amylolyticum]|uniref:LamG-like jellyroll fold domain-containing protein n=1 Tax=Halosimplex amylolyticum TaxID=3396616 RepID=UPI003F57D954